MLGSLRFRLPAFFLIGIVVAGIVAALISLRLFQDFTRNASLTRSAARPQGSPRSTVSWRCGAADEGKNAPVIVPEKLEEATGDEIFYVGSSLFPGSGLGSRAARTERPAGRRGGSHRREDLRVHATRTGARLPRRRSSPSGSTRMRHRSAHSSSRNRRRCSTTSGFRSGLRLGLASMIGLAVAGLLSWWLSRRISGPVLALEDAAGEIAQGNYAVRVEVGTGGDEITSLQLRFNEMAARLGATEEHERQFLMSVLPRAAHAADRDPRPRRRVARRRGRRPGSRPDVARRRRSGAMRLERLVGDVLDLAQLNAHRFTVLDRGSRHAAAAGAGVLRLR